MINRLSILFVMMVIALAGCEKDELTKPAEVDFVFRMNSFEREWDNDDDQDDDDDLKSMDHQSRVSNGKPEETDNPFGKGKAPVSFAIQKSHVTVTGIEIEGKREQGQDVFLTRDFNPPLEIELENDDPIDYDVSFDIPQGIYTKLEFQFHLGNEEHPAFEFSGPVTGPALEKVDFRFQYKPKEKIRVRALRESHQVSENIIIDKHKQKRATIIIDTEYLFRNITQDQLVHSRASGKAVGNPFIMVDQQNNQHIFGGITNSLEKSISVVFE